MTNFRFSDRNCMPARLQYPASHQMMNWFWNDFENGKKDRSVPLANIVETKEDFRIELTVPGFSKSDFKIKLEDQVLHISSDREETGINQEESYIRHEFSCTAFNRSFHLSYLVDSGSIIAKYENGILSVNIPKTEQAKSKPAREIAID